MFLNQEKRLVFKVQSLFVFLIIYLNCFLLTGTKFLLLRTHRPNTHSVARVLSGIDKRQKFDIRNQYEHEGTNASKLSEKCCNGYRSFSLESTTSVSTTTLLSSFVNSDRVVSSTHNCTDPNAECKGISNIASCFMS